MMKRLAAVVLAALAFFPIVLSGDAQAQNRVALVIGNTTYSNATALANPANDAADVTKSLQNLGFNVTTVTDAKFDQFRRALIDFGRAARSADMAILFFAGHGVEIMGENWLLPVDAQLANDVDVGSEAVSLRAAMLAVSNAKTLGVVILDACRNNPFTGKMRRADPAPAADPGLAPIEPAENVLVAYAARDGTTASDGNGRNSPYTSALLKHLETPGLEIEFLFRNVRDDVMSATNNEQQPYLYGSLSREEIYLKDGAPAQTASAPAPEQATPDAAEIAWSFLNQTSDTETLQRFVDQFPSSARVADAKTRIASLDKAQGKTYALASAEFDTLTRQIARPFLKNAPEIDAAWDVIKHTNDGSVIRRFSEQFPSKRRETAARERLTELGEPTAIPRDLLLRAAANPDVIQCYRANDPGAPECQRALQQYPGIAAFLLDFRFRHRLCEALGELGHCNTVEGVFWTRPLFHWRHHEARRDHGSQAGSHHGKREHSAENRRGRDGKASRHAREKNREGRSHNRVARAHREGGNNGPRNNGPQQNPRHEAQNFGHGGGGGGGGGGRHR